MAHAHQVSGNGNGNGFNLNGMSPWMRFVVIVGPSTAIALFLVWQMNGRNALQLDRIESRVEAHAISATDVAQRQAETTAALMKASESDRALLRSLISLMRQVCVNTAKNDDSRQKCVQ